MRKKIRGTGLIALLMISLPACSNSKIDAPAEDVSITWNFSISTNDITVRSAPETALSRSVGMAAYVFDTGGPVGQPGYMWNEEVVRNENGWNTVNGFEAPEAGKSIQFLAYYPYAPQVNDPALSLSEASATGPVSIGYKVPQDVTAQLDVMTGESAVLSTDEENKNVHIIMHHRLAAIQFVTGDIGLAGTIKSITLKNIHDKGSYQMGNDGWVLQAVEEGTSFSVYPEYEVSGVTLAEDPDGRQPVATGENTFLMLPQPIPDNARMTIEYEATKDGVTEIHTLEARLKSNRVSEWQWGKIYTYQISVVSLALEYETFVHDWELGGETDVEINI